MFSCPFSVAESNREISVTEGAYLGPREGWTTSSLLVVGPPSPPTPSSDSRCQVQNDLALRLFGVRRIPCRFGLFSDRLFFEPIFISKK